MTQLMPSERGVGAWVELQLVGKKSSTDLLYTKFFFKVLFFSLYLFKDCSSSSSLLLELSHFTVENSSDCGHHFPSSKLLSRSD